MLQYVSNSEITKLVFGEDSLEVKRDSLLLKVYCLIALLPCWRYTHKVSKVKNIRLYKYLQLPL